MSQSRRFHLNLPAPLEAEITEFARQHGLALGPAIRLLVGQALEGSRHERGHESPTVLATLTAAEHAVLMVAAVLPEGQRRMRELATQAAVAAEERLSLFRESGR